MESDDEKMVDSEGEEIVKEYVAIKQHWTVIAYNIIRVSSSRST